MVDSHHSYAADLSSPVMTAPRLGAALLPSSQCRPRAPSRASIPGAWIAPSVEILRLDMLGKDCAPYLAAAFAPVQARHRMTSVRGPALNLIFTITVLLCALHGFRSNHPIIDAFADLS